jgi:hypothetical protein
VLSGDVVYTNDIIFRIDNDPPRATEKIVIQETRNTITNEESLYFSRPPSYDDLTNLAYYTMRIYGARDQLLYNIQLSQQELYMAKQLFPAGEYMISLTATDMLGNESQPYRRYFSIRNNRRIA